MIEIILWFVILVVIYASYEIFVIRKEKALANMKNNKELAILQKKYKLDYSKHNMKEVVRLVALANAFILSTVVAIVVALQNWISNLILWALSVFAAGTLLITPLILISYSMIGKILQKKQGGKNKNV